MKARSWGHHHGTSVSRKRNSPQRSTRAESTATFVRADITSLSDFDNRLSTVTDCTLFHSLPLVYRDSSVGVVIHRAAAPGARYFVLVFAPEAFGSDFPYH